MRHLLEIRSMDSDSIHDIVERARFYQRQDGRCEPILRNRFIANLFLEPSTRTRFSFEIAERKLGAEVLTFSEETSSRVKGETIYDTIRTLEAMDVDAAVVRSRESELLLQLQEHVHISLINAGAGNREHPSQALLDVLTMIEHFGSVSGLTVGIVGDIAHSRVVGSHMHLLPKLGAQLFVAGATGMLDRTDDPLPADVQLSTMDEIVQHADVVMMLRVQHERHMEAMKLSLEQYHQQFGLTKERALHMKQGAVIMHPAPFNRGVEIDSTLVESERSLIFQQVTNGVFTRMAILECTVGGKNE